MGWWRIDTDALAGSRFVVSALAETTAALMALRWRSAGHPGERDWLAARLPAFQEYLAAEPVTAEVLRAALGRQWIADYLTPPPDGRPFEEELESIRATPDAVVRTNLRAASRPAGAALRARGLGPRTAELLEWVWAEAVRPDWERRRRVAEADVLVRTRQLSLGGWSAALSGMRPGMAWPTGTPWCIRARASSPSRTRRRPRRRWSPCSGRCGRGCWCCWRARSPRPSWSR
ncbi:hypothetical protein [Streptomyces goshikiensis]|uniref:hypothetical protein n=1 Tax=Streptomyces goshikiensis TaxID=1942 RepID=UPI003D9E6D6B